MPEHKQDPRSPDAKTGRRSSDEANGPGSMRLSMHDGVEVWCDCCSCEAEPYWLAAFEKDAAAGED